MNRLDSLDLDAADLRRIDEIMTSQTGQGLAAEVAQWRKRRNQVWLAIGLSVLLLGVAGAWLMRVWMS